MTSGLSNDEKAKIFELTSGNAEKPEKIVTVKDAIAYVGTKK